MSFAPDDEMIETLAPDRSDQPFSEAILPRRTWCDGLVPYAHGMQTAGDDGAVDAIPIANNVVRGLVPREKDRRKGGRCSETGRIFGLSAATQQLGVGAQHFRLQVGSST